MGEPTIAQIRAAVGLPAANGQHAAIEPDNDGPNHDEPAAVTEARRQQGEQLATGHDSAPVDGPDDDLSHLQDQFWSARPVLQHIRRFSYARMVAPWPVLGMLLLRCAHHVPPGHTLPPLIGGRASLNLFVAAVARSGGGKSSSEAAAEDCISFDSTTPMFTSRLGSGEGIARSYAHYDKNDGVVMDREAVLWTCGEVTELASLSGRRGATLLPQLREAFGAGRLGFGYADRDKAIQLEPHSYRFGLFVNVQTRLSGILFDDSDAGTPQRFLWLPAADPTITADPPAEPGQMRVPMWSPSGSEVQALTVPDQAAAEVREAHAARQRGDGDALDGHALLVREKVAQLLALLDGRREMRGDDWELAGIVAAVSDQTRGRALAEVRRAAAERVQSQGRSDGVRQLAADAVRDDDRQKATQRVGRRSLRLIQDAGDDGMPWKLLRRRTRNTDRPLLQDAVDNLAEAGLIAEHIGPQGGAVYVAK